MIIEADINEALLPTGVFAEMTQAGQVAGAASGYMVTNVAGWRYRFTAAEPLLGIYRLLFFDGDGVTVDVRYVRITAGATTVLASDSHTECRLLELIDALSVLVGTPAGASMSADIAAAKAVVDQTATRLGTPTGATVSADIAAAKAVVDQTATRLGAPTGATVSADIAAAKAVVDQTATRLGAPTGATVSADIAAAKAVVDQTATRLGTPAGASVAAELTAAAAEIAKIPRAAAALAGGEAYRRSNQFDEYVDEIFSKKAS